MGIDVGNTCICKHAHRFIFSVFGYFVMDALFVGDMGYGDDDDPTTSTCTANNDNQHMFNITLEQQPPQPQMLMDPPAAMVSLPTDSNEQLSSYARMEVDSAGGSNNTTHPQLTTTMTMRDNSQLLLIIAFSSCVRFKGVFTRFTKGI